jgi:hypothetical protein
VEWPLSGESSYFESVAKFKLRKQIMVAKVVELLKDPENFGIILFLLYVIVLTHIVGFFVLQMIS